MMTAPTEAIELPDPLSAWLERHQRSLWRYLRLLGCPSDQAEDIVQETLLVGWRGGVHERSGSGSWLRVTARNQWFSRLRKPERRAVEVGIEDLDDLWLRVARDDGGEAERARLRECLALLQPRARQALELRYGERSSRGDMAAAMGMGDEGVKSVLQRARAFLRRCIEERRTRDGC